MQSLRKMWSRIFGKYLWLTNTASGGGLLAVGDGIQQHIEHITGSNASLSYDWARTGKMFMVGLCSGPPHHFFYIYLDKIIIGRSTSAVGKKILVDQFFGAPMFAAIFFGVAGHIEGKTFEKSCEEFTEKFPIVWAIDWLIWPPSQLINFLYVPAPYRVLYVNVVTVFWNVFMSYIKHKDLKTKIPEG